VTNCKPLEFNSSLRVQTKYIEYEDYFFDNIRENIKEMSIERLSAKGRNIGSTERTAVSVWLFLCYF